MAQVILKKSSISARVPLASDLEYGELALNYADGMLYFKMSDGMTISSIGSSINLDAPPAIGGTTPAAGAFTTLTASSNFSGRINPRVFTATTATSITPDVSQYDQYCLTAQASALAINAPTGTPVDGTKLIIRILDSGTSRALTWTTTSGGYRIIGTTLPASTTINKTIYVGCIYNAATTFWDVVSVTTQV